MKEIFERKSTRNFTDKPVEEEKIKKILQAGTAGPSAVNSRDWAFIVLKDKEKMKVVSDLAGLPTKPLKEANFGILLCGDLNRSHKVSPDYYVIDGAIAGQNMLLEAEHLGVGGVWLGVWPQADRVAALKDYFELPDGILPHSLFAFGYAREKQDRVRPERPEWDADRIHYEKW